MQGTHPGRTYLLSGGKAVDLALVDGEIKGLDARAAAQAFGLEAFASEYIKLLEIKTASADTPIKSLSGGNQQKCILARWLLTDPRVFGSFTGAVMPRHLLQW